MYSGWMWGGLSPPVYAKILQNQPIVNNLTPLAEHPTPIPACTLRDICLSIREIKSTSRAVEEAPEAGSAMVWTKYVQRSR